MFGRFTFFNSRRTRKNTSDRRPKSPRQRLLLQALEDRAVPATFTVTNTTDGTVTGAGQLPGSLRQAIFDANAAAGADSIDMTGVLGSISLSAGQLSITDSVVVNGPGAANLTVDGAGASRVFNVSNSATGSITVTMSNFTISGGKLTGAGNDGGGVNIADEDVTLDGMKLTGNAAYRGGAVALNATGGKLSILNTSITGNNTTGGTDGGGVFFINFNGSLKVDNSDISGNIAQAGGGGLYIGGVTDFTISNSSITGNTANSTITSGAGGGGGVIVLGTVNSGTAYFQNTTIAYNQTAAASGSGGGVAVGTLVGDLRFQNCTLTGNFASITGGAFSRFAGRGNTYFESSVVSGNASTNGTDIWNSFPTFLDYSAVGSAAGFTQSGGANNLPFGATLNLDGSAKNNGGTTLTVMPLNGSPLINSGNNFTLFTTDQRGTGFARSVGGQVDIGAAEVQAADTVPSAVATVNQPTVGTGSYTVAVVYRDDLGVDTTTIDINDLTISGFGYIGAVAATGVLVAGSGGSVTATYTFPAPNNNGFNTWDPLDNASTFTISHDGSVSDAGFNFVTAGPVGILNTRFTQTFGASDLSTLATAISNANNSLNSHDTVDLSGIVTPTTITLAGEFVISDSLTIKGPGAGLLTIQGSGTGRLFNIAGPGAVNFNLDKVTLTGGNLSGTGNTIRGGTIFSEDDPITITNSVITGNTVTAATTAGGDGAGVAMYRGNLLTIANCTFSSNTANGSRADGGAIYVGRSGAASIDNSIITGNVSQSSGGGIYAVNSLFTLTDSLVSGNYNPGTGAAYAGGGGIYFLGSANRVTIVNSTISGNTSALPGGGIMLRASGTFTSFFNIYNSTITNNRSFSQGVVSGAAGGGGIAQINVGSPINIESSIVQGNYASTFADVSSLGAITAKNSAFGSKSGMTSFVDGGGNLIGQDIKLGSLASNGAGDLQSHLPGPGSPLIGAGTNASSGVTTDQIGNSRTMGGSVDIGAVESAGTNPVALTPTLANVTVGGGTTYGFDVTYLGSVNLDATSFDNNDVRVTGPNGFNVLATRGAIVGSGTKYTVSYSFTTPGGKWDGADNGFYTVSLEPTQVKDSSSVFVSKGTLGQFQVTTPKVYFVNTNLNDESSDTDGKLSLREAVLAANASAGQDTIQFDPSVFTPGTTILLTGGMITITDHVVIEGQGAANTIIDAGKASRIFSITDATSGRRLNVDLNKLTFTNGFNTALDSGRGGAVFMLDEDVTINDSVFTNNEATAGGAIAANGASGNLTINRTTFSNNSAIGATSTVRGGALRTTTAVYVTISDSTFENNTAFAGGGSMYLLNSGLSMSRTTVSGNQVTNAASNGYGGGIMLGGSQDGQHYTISNSTIYGNTAQANGGGIWMSVGELTINNSTISGNTSNVFNPVGSPTPGSGGGGIRISQANSTVRINSSIIAGNVQSVLSGTALANDINANTGALYAQNSAFSATNAILIDPGTATRPNNFYDLGNNIYSGNLQLGPLQINDGASVKTVAIGTDSDAIDRGSNPDALTIDQAGNNRVRGPRIDIGAYEAAASANVADAPRYQATLPATITAGGAATFDVVVVYSDVNNGIDTTTIDVTDLKVKGGGAGTVLNDVNAKSVNVSGSGSSVTATYTFDAPGGAWQSNTNAENGLYTVTLVGGSVSDLGANSVVATDTGVGQFRNQVGRIIPVTNDVDSGPGSLRQAVLDANSITFAVSTIDTISFTGDFTINLSTTAAAGSALVLADSVVIQGTGASKTTVNNTVAATRVFDVNVPGSGTVTLDAMTISGGTFTAASQTGAGVRVQDETLVLSNAVLTGNKMTGATSNGAGIAVMEGGSVVVQNSTISNNTTTNQGGGIFVQRNASNLTIQNSTITGNSALHGGGAYFLYGGGFLAQGSTFSQNRAGTTASGVGGGVSFTQRATEFGYTIQNSTFSGNTSGSVGGGVQFNSQTNTTNGIPFHFQNVTFTLNRSNSTGTANGSGGGGLNRSGSGDSVMAIDSSIFAGNIGNNPDISSAGTVVATKNVIGNGQKGFVLTSADNQFGLTASLLDPMLDPLANNGGPTDTHALKAGSPAIDMGYNPASLLTDQRGAGFNRLSGVAVDVGAFEVQSVVTPPPTATVKIDSGTGQRSMIQSITVTFSEAVVLGANPFTVTRLGTSTIPTPAGNVILSVSPAGPASVFTITFNDPTFAPTVGSAKSLIDGLYSVTLNAADITSQANGQQLDGNGDTTPGDSQTSNFHRLFGDINGDGFTDNIDLVAFRLANGSTGPAPPYDAGFDVNGDNFIDNNDLLAFRDRIGDTP